MSSGFVSGGTTDAPVERSDEWLAAQKEIEANRQRKAAETRQSDGRSLYETLEANKAAKQEAFEEANRLKNQFRSLDEDEIEFLDSVLESTRAEEARVKKETAEGLEAFRRQQDEADKKARRDSDGATNTEDGSAAIEEEQWVPGGRKRKRAKDKEVLKGVKIRRSSTLKQPKDSEGATEKPKEVSASVPAPLTKKPSEETKTLIQAQPSKSEETSAKKSPSGGLGLVDYGSDDDD